MEPTGYLNADFQLCLTHLMNHGLEACPRGTTTKELLNYNISLFNPRNRIITLKDRKTSLKYLLGEFIWYASGSSDPARILPYSKFWANILNSDGTTNSNYGNRLFGHHDGSGVPANTGDISQWQAVKDILIKDPDSRQAIINIHLPVDRYSGNKDVPCTLFLQFLIRENRLNLIVGMRSNDIWLGFTNDVFQFTMLQECMQLELAEAIPSLELGHYYHNAGSMHIYDRHFEKANEVIADKKVIDMSMIPMDVPLYKVKDDIIAIEKATDLLTFEEIEKLPEWIRLTPYWQLLFKACFFNDDQAFVELHGLSDH